MAVAQHRPGSAAGNAGRVGIIAAFALCALVPLASGCADKAPVSAPDDASQDPQVQLAAGKARSAMLGFEEAIARNPDDIPARLGLSQALILLGDFDRAEKMARVVLRRGPDAAAGLVVAEALYGLDDLTAAEAMLEQAGPPADRAALGSLIAAERLFRAGDATGALRIIGPAARHPRFKVPARYLGARAQYARGDYVRAQQLVDIIIATGGPSVPAQLLQAQLALRSGDFDRAQTLAEATMRDDEGNVSAGAIAIEALLRRGEAAEARQVLGRLAPTSPNDPRPAYLQALVLAAEGKTSDAATVAGPIEVWLVDAPGGAAFLGGLWVDLERFAQAEHLLSRRLRVAPEDGAARVLLARVLDATERAGEADQLLASATAAADASPFLLRLAAARLIGRDRPDEALALLARAEAAAARGVPALRQDDGQQFVRGTEKADALAMAVAALGAGDQQAAMAAATRVSAMLPDDPLAQNLLAAAELRAGDNAGASARLDRIIKTHPDFLAAILNRAALDAAPQALRQHLEAAVAAGATGPSVLGQLAIERFVDGDTKGAIDMARKAQAAGEPSALLARLQMAQGDKAGAIATLNALAADADTGAARARIGRLLLEAGDARGAQTLLRPVTGAPLDARTADALVALERRLGPEVAALATIKASLERAPDDADLRSAFYRAEAVLTPAVARKRILAEPVPAGGASLAEQAELLALAGARGAALTRISSAPPDVATAGVWAGLVESQAERAQLLETLVKVAGQYPEQPALNLVLSGVALDAGDLRLAETAAQRALLASPGDPFALNNLALARAPADAKGALALATQAYQTAPGIGAIADTYARLLRENGRADLAARVAARQALSRAE